MLCMLAQVAGCYIGGSAGFTFCIPMNEPIYKYRFIHCQIVDSLMFPEWLDCRLFFSFTLLHRSNLRNISCCREHTVCDCDRTVMFHTFCQCLLMVSVGLGIDNSNAKQIDKLLLFYLRGYLAPISKCKSLCPGGCNDDLSPNGPHQDTHNIFLLAIQNVQYVIYPALK